MASSVPIYLSMIPGSVSLTRSICTLFPCRSRKLQEGHHELIRQHQFHKVELVKIFCPEQADEAHESLTAHARSLLELGLAYRMVRLCGGDIE